MSIMQQVLSRTLLPVVIICCLSFAGVMALRSNGHLENLELGAYDWFVRFNRGTSLSDPRIVIIEITENDILQLERWPITDAMAAETLSLLSSYKPRAIGFDIYRDIPVPPGTEELNTIFTENHNIISVMKFGSGGIPPPKVLAQSNQAGFNDFVVDPGGIVRRGLLFMDNGEIFSYSFSLLLALTYLQKEGINLEPDTTNPEYLRLGAATIPPFEKNDGGYINADARGYQYLLDFGLDVPFTTFTLGDFLAGSISPDAFKEKIVLIGVTAQSVKDLFYTPYSRGITDEQQSVAGVFLHAQAVSQLLRISLGESRPVKTLVESSEVWWILLWSFIGGGVGFRLRSPWLFSLCGAIGVSVVWLITFFAFTLGWWIPSVPPVIAFLLSAALVTSFMSHQEKKKRQVIMQLFSKHVSPEVAASIWRQRDLFFSGGRPRSQKMAATVLFSDLQGYTGASERLAPQTLIEWLNMYLEAMADLLMDYGGVVDDYAGDGIKADFGVPVPRSSEADIKNDAVQAVRCAIAMGQKMERLNIEWKRNGLPEANLRIGILSGDVVAGVLGSSQRLKYTTVGDTVNTAARLESYDKKYVGDRCWRILIGDSTRQYLDSRFRVEFVGEVKLRGKDNKTAIYQVLDLDDQDDSSGCPEGRNESS